MMQSRFMPKTLFAACAGENISPYNFLSLEEELS